MKYVILSMLALTVAVSSVSAQARPREKAKKHKKQIGKHPNGNPVPPSATVVLAGGI